MSAISLGSCVAMSAISLGNQLREIYVSFHWACRTLSITLHKQNQGSYSFLKQSIVYILLALTGTKQLISEPGYGN